MTTAQLALLRSAAQTADGTVLVAGFNKGTHATVTAKALAKRGLVVLHKHGRGYDVYRLTPDGRVAARNIATTNPV